MRRLKVLLLGVWLSCAWLICMPSVYAANELEHVQLKVYLNPAGAPFSFFKGDLTHMHGIDVDIITELQRRLGFSLAEDRIYPLLPEQAFLRMDEGLIDIYGGGLGYNKIYANKYATLPVYVKSSMGVLYSKNQHSNINTTQDLEGLTITVLPGRHSEHFVEEFRAHLDVKNDLSFAIFSMAQGDVDAIIYDRLILDTFKNDVKVSGLELLPDEFGRELCQYTFYIPRLSPYRSLLTRTMLDMTYDGTIKRILKHWGVKVPEPKFKFRRKAK